MATLSKQWQPALSLVELCRAELEEVDELIDRFDEEPQRGNLVKAREGLISLLKALLR